VTRDKDLLDLLQYEGIAIVTPEAFLTWLRSTLP
jgi:predicted nucleic acid-binding protein